MTLDDLPLLSEDEFRASCRRGDHWSLCAPTTVERWFAMPPHDLGCRVFAWAMVREAGSLVKRLYMLSKAAP